MILVRYADDIVAGFQYQLDAKRFQKDLQRRFHKFNLELHPEKTRLIQFGRFAAERRAAMGKGKPETFNFLGFTHICAKSSKGKFLLLRLPMRQRFQAKLKEIRVQLKIRRYRPISETGRWLRSVISGWYRYYAVPNTSRYLGKFRRGNCVAVVQGIEETQPKKPHELAQDVQTDGKMASSAENHTPISPSTLARCTL
jgi:hypothetical protein